MVSKGKIFDLRSQGKTQKQIAEEVCCHESYVWLVLRNFGLTEFKAEMSAIERLNRRLKINSLSQCWEFQGAKFSEGYGQIKVDGVSYRAYRLAYALLVGEIPEGMLVCHNCDNPGCCNPEHLFLGTNADNMTDKVLKGRHSRGLSLPQTKATEDKVALCFRLKKEGKSNREIAKILEISHPTVSRWLNSK